ncbi:SURF1 family protein [Agrococcus sp. ARC_14]|uniref:SURF1 family cytochrome oxidase biogenesis protein n=1 Tax=Agrococcus sp. ARC_14 TaxID=2919927 RepID=UPI001F067B4E|nr:SURF1 family protein [Agrococcus sp. ARC_14]MCH1883167.1 SURF1 family protein [Agrococcus sp. ARC_14]
MLRLLREPRWLGYIGLAVVFAVVCCLLGSWQWNRREEALTAIDRLESNYDREPAAVAEVLPELDTFDPDQQWTPVLLEGEYLLDQQLLLRGRWQGGQVGFDVIAPFRTTDGTVMIVDRGWIDQASGAEQPVSDPATPAGPTTVVARLRPNEGSIAGRGAPEGQIASVDLPSLSEQLGLPSYTGAYGLLVSEAGGVPADVSVATRPVLDEGPHLSYTLQWFVFALGGFAAVAWGMRDELRSESPVERPKRGRRTDADVEDDILDRS